MAARVYDVHRAGDKYLSEVIQESLANANVSAHAWRPLAKKSTANQRTEHNVET